MSDAPPRNRPPVKALPAPQAGGAGGAGSGVTAPPSAASADATARHGGARHESASGEGATAAKDVVLLGPPTADGAGVHVIRARHERIEVGELRALQEGRPIVGEIVTLTPREANPRVCDVTESYCPSAAQPAQLGHKGPANVATDAYREGWDEIFGPKPRTPHGAN